MRLGFLLLSAEMTRASVAWAEEPPPLMKAMLSFTHLRTPPLTKLLN